MTLFSKYFIALLIYVRKLQFCSSSANPLSHVPTHRRRKDNIKGGHYIDKRQLCCPPRTINTPSRPVRYYFSPV